MIVFCGRYGGQRWEDLERMPMRKLTMFHDALAARVAEESVPPTPTGR